MATKIIIITALYAVAAFIPNASAMSVIAKQSSTQNSTVMVQQLTSQVVALLNQVQKLVDASLLAPLLSSNVDVLIPEVITVLQSPGVQADLVQVVNLLYPQTAASGKAPNLIQVLTALVKALAPVGAALTPVSGSLGALAASLLIALTTGVAPLIAGLSALLGAPLALPAFG